MNLRIEEMPLVQPVLRRSREFSMIPDSSRHFGLSLCLIATVEPNRGQESVGIRIFNLLFCGLTLIIHKAVFMPLKEHTLNFASNNCCRNRIINHAVHESLARL